jgi:hypothetical protein
MLSEAAFPLVPAGYLAVIAGNTWRSPASAVNIGPRTLNTVLDVNIIARLISYAIPNLTELRKLWIKGMFDAFLARASRDKMTSELT